MGKVRVGTSGFSYEEWYGSFYPEDLRKEDMLSYYAKHFDTCEINNTFYKMPTPALVKGWAAQVPARFSFVLKASLKITHLRLIEKSAPFVGVFARAHAELGKRTGPVLFQTAAYQKKDVTLLRKLFAAVPGGMRLAMDFGDPSWLDDEVYAILEENDAALVVVDDENRPPWKAHGALAYVRLRRPTYSKDDLRRWAERVRHPRFTKGAYVFFKHEDEGRGPALGKRFQEALDRA
jgi:uncharacterized protein YecE (DUF72 family)